MKKIIGVLAIVLIGCASPDPVEVEAKDCNCDKVVEARPAFRLTDGTAFGFYTTINECSGVQREGRYSGTTPPKLGTCK
jgi:hypothetical protein